MPSLDLAKEIENVDIRISALAEEAKVAAKWLKPKDWIERYVLIRPEGGGWIRFILNKAQVHFIEWFTKKLAAREPIKAIILKARRLGFSTLLEALQLYLSHRFPGIRCLTLAHSDDSTKEIFEIGANIWRDMNDEVRCPLKKGDEPTEKGFRLKNGSRLQHITAGAKGIKRGDRFNFMQWDEQGHYENIPKVKASVGQCLARPTATWRSWHIKLGTANGINEFKSDWDAAQLPDSQWQPFFYSWIDDVLCRLEPPPNFVRTEEEKVYAAKVKKATGVSLDDHQILWARRQRIDELGGDWNLFNQEYPAYAELAFLSMARAIFAQEEVSRQLKDVAPVGGAASQYPPIFRGDIVWKSLKDPTPVLVADPLGPLRIWPANGLKVTKEKSGYKLHIPNGRRAIVEGKEVLLPDLYAQGVDTGEGVGGNYSESVMTDCQTDEMVAHYRSNRIRPQEYAIKMWLLGKLFNWALMIVEANTIGQTVLGVLEHGHGDRKRFPPLKRYPNLYYELVYDRKLRAERKSLGWRASGGSKKTLVNLLAEYFSTGNLSIYSPELLLQFQGYRETTKKDGKTTNRQPYDQTYLDPISGQRNDDGITACGLSNVGRLEISLGNIEQWAGNTGVQYAEA